MSFDKIIYRLTDKRIPAATGIGLVGDILDNAGFQEQFSKVRSEDKRSRKQMTCGAIMTSFIGLLCMGKPDFEAIAEFKNDAHIIRLPSSEERLSVCCFNASSKWTRSEKHSVNSYSISMLIF